MAGKDKEAEGGKRAMQDARDGILLAIRFSFITNKLSYCGPGAAHHAFLTYAEGKATAEEVRRAIIRFEGLWPYLSAIAEKCGKDPFSYEVVEAYWIGSPLLDIFTREDNADIIRRLTGRGLPKFLGERLIGGLPQGFVPHHDFNVFYVGVGMITGSVQKNLANTDHCRISWGTVVEVRPDFLVVKARPLQVKRGKYVLGQEETRTALYMPKLLGAVKTGDIVALHWGFACMVLAEEQQANLKTYSQKIIDVMNKVKR